MNTQLPSFEGTPVQASNLKLTGSAELNIGALAHDEECYLVVQGTVEKVTHGDGKSGDAVVFTRSHTVKASRVVLVTADDGQRMLDEALMLADERFGIQTIFGSSGLGVDPETGEITE